MVTGYKRAVLCWHRGCGKDLFALNWLVRRAIKEPGVYLHCFPTYHQGKRAIWKSIHGDDQGGAIPYLDHFPPESIKNINGSEMMITLKNGSIYCVMGIDGKNAARARGMNPKDVILSEYAFMDPESWRTIEPRVLQNKGTAIFLSTPNGQNHFYDLYNIAKHDSKQYFTSFLTIADTKMISSAEIDNLRKEGVPEDFIQQEYYCSFNRGVEGSYYGKLIQKAREEDRITHLPIRKDLPVYTGWDIGYGDYTAIWWFQVFNNGLIHFIHYYQNHNEGIEHYIKYCRDYQIKHDFLYGKHFAPFDIKNGEFGTGNTRLEIARSFGFEMKPLEKQHPQDGIQAVRSQLPMCFFNASECVAGIKCLDFYRKKYNDTLKVYYDEPCHDKWSHGADAFRYSIQAIRQGYTDMNNNVSNEIKALDNYFGRY